METAWAPIGRAMRVVLGLAQEDWAATLEVSRKTVGRWERGDAVPDDAVEARILLGCAADGIFERAKRTGVPLGVDGPDQLRDALAADRAARRLGRTDAGLIGRDGPQNMTSTGRARSEYQVICAPPTKSTTFAPGTRRAAVACSKSRNS